MTDSLRDTNEAHAINRRITDGKSKPEDEGHPPKKPESLGGLGNASNYSIYTPVVTKIIDLFEELYAQQTESGQIQPVLRIHVIEGEDTFFQEELKKQLEEKHGCDGGLANATSRVCITFYVARHYPGIQFQVSVREKLRVNHRFMIIDSTNPTIDIILQ